MKSSDHEVPEADEGVRRRRSTHHEDDSMMPVADDTQSRTQSSAPLATTASAIEVTGEGRASLPSEPHVRFSIGGDLSSSVGTSSAAGDNHGPSARSGDAVNSRRPGTPNLSIDTALKENKPNDSRSSALLKTATSRLSPSPISPVSPLSPKSRHRGYSLRRSIFNKNISGGTSEDHGEVIEMGSAGPSRGATGTIHERDLSEKSPKSTTSVIVSPIPQIEEEIPLPPKTYKKLDPGVIALPNYESWLQKRKARFGLPNWAKQAYQESRKRILRINEIPPSKDGRHLDLDVSREKALVDERTGRPYVGNTIRSSRHTVWNFLPRQLVAQFSKLANAYFLCVSILQMIPGLSTTGTYTTIIPLLFFVAISMAKEGYEDVRRYRLDKEENNREATVLRAYEPTSTPSETVEGFVSTSTGPKHWTKIKWKDIEVGDILKLRRDEAIPADMTLLHVAGENHMAYVETMALDGETNLKSKQPSAAFSKRCSTSEDLGQCNAHFVVEDPNLDLYNFEGRVAVDDETLPLTNNEIIYRGSVLRNTAQAIGIVLYSGQECKIRMNAVKNPRIKAPALQTVVNKVVIIIVIFVVALALYNAIAYLIWESGTEEKAWYLTDAKVSFGPALTSFIIMFNTMVPLSLYVSLEIVKVCQMRLLDDIDMYDETSNTPMEARTSTINEELGQVRFVKLRFPHKSELCC